MSSDRWFLDSTPTAKYPAWTRGNAADVFPGPFSPLAYDLILRDGMSKGLRDAYTSIGAINYDEYDNPERPDLFHVFGGYPYNPLTMTRIFGARMPGASPELIDKAFFDINGWVSVAFFATEVVFGSMSQWIMPGWSYSGWSGWTGGLKLACDSSFQPPSSQMKVLRRGASFLPVALPKASATTVVKG